MGYFGKCPLAYLNECRQSIITVDFSNIFSGSQQVQLAESNVPPHLGGKQRGFKTGSEIERLDKVLLEQQFVNDGLVFNIIVKYVTGVLKYKGGYTSTDASEQAILDEYARNFKLNTKVLPKDVQDQALFGTSWDEKIFDKEGKILRLSNRDAKFMDISRKGYGTDSIPWMNTYDEPKFYVQYIPQNMIARHTGRQILQMGRRAIKFEPEEIVKIDLFTVGDSEDGLGIIEPMYQSIINKQLVQESVTAAIFRVGHPIIYGSVGDERVYPTKNLIDQVSENIIDVNSRTGFAIPNYVDLKILESKGAKDLTDNLGYFVDQVVMGSGMPKALATGAGDGSNKHTLDSLLQFLSGAFLMMRNNIAEAHETQILPHIAMHEQFSNGWETRLQFKWSERTKQEIEDIGGAEDDRSTQ